MNMKWTVAAIAAGGIAIAAIFGLRAFGGTDREEPVKSAAAAAVKPAPVHGQAGQVVRAARTSRLALDFRTDTAEIKVTDLASGAVWTSNPVDRDADSIAKGVKKQDLNAQLLLDYVDPQNKPFQLNNFTGSVKSGTFTWKPIASGIEVDFEFPQAGFVIPVQYSLKDDGFVATVAADRIEQQGKYRLVNVNLLPFFGAGGLKDEGYLFVPDGSGALIRFNNGKSLYKSYDDRVYGGDLAVDRPEAHETKEDIRIPVFGLKRGASAYVAVIHKGSYQAGITASVSRKNNQYNAVSSYLNLLEFETNVLMEGTANEKTVVRASASTAGGQPFEVRYYFLNGDKADYAGMAERYRQYLTEEQGVKPFDWPKAGQLPLMLEIIGGVKKRDTFLGIPYTTVEALTSFDDLRRMTDRLIGKGIRTIGIRYEGWTSGGMKDEVPTSPDAETALGGNKSFRKLASDLKQKGVAFYPAVDPVQLYENGNGFNKFMDAAKNISRAPALIRSYLLSTGAKDRNVRPWYLLKPESVREAVGRYSESARKKGIGRTAYQSIGSMVYSDFRKRMLSKNETGRIWEESLKTAASRSEGLSFDHANAYAFSSAENVTDVPLYSSRYDVEDDSVPFYSIALSGLIPAYSEPINLAGNTRAYLLKLIETGTFPAYRFVAGDGSRLIGTEFDGLYSGGFEPWFDDVAAEYRELDEALRPILGQPIVDHDQIAEGVYRTVFANGKTAAVNYTDKTATVDGEPVEPNGYRIR
ncbi:DUF5696 domain-containing protein [Cohnella candidum]|uniref:Uncharacterized protein n=1 Tax=Cohnella candidum TaxID=2674991 RepID=A0A3G3JZZ1_9BACL|nr:DUF5696 domain-containing protein [Cohnella candidum]AYQ73733.1 hypothetical protein EAV92_14795 [Cohnella candidum]